MKIKITATNSNTAYRLNSLKTYLMTRTALSEEGEDFRKRKESLRDCQE